MLSPPHPAETGSEGTFHHLIALFCTVAGKVPTSGPGATKYCNEINNLAPVDKILGRQNPLMDKHLAIRMHVIPESNQPAGTSRDPSASFPMEAGMWRKSQAAARQWNARAAAEGAGISCEIPARL